MKQTVRALILLALILVATPVAAQGLRAEVGAGASTTPGRVEVRNEVEARVETRRADAEVRQASSTDRRNENRAEMQNNVSQRLVLNVERVLSATVDRLERIALRIESRIEKMREAGSDTAQSESAVVEAKNHLRLADESIEAFASVEISTGTVRENMLKIREAAQVVKAHLREAHTSLKDAVMNLKASAEAEVEVEAGQ